MGNKRIKLQLEGVRFGKLVVTKDVGVNEQGTYMWLCKCDCGNEKIVKGASLKYGSTRSCGCGIIEAVIKTHTKHGAVNSVEYTAWEGMKARCYNKNTPKYSEYGGRGISVCERWRNSFENFLLDMGIKPSNEHSLDRFPNNDGNYEPSNCRWATDYQQLRNTRRNVWIEYNGERIALTDLAKILGIHYITLRYQLRTKSVEEAIIAVKNNAIKTSKFTGVSYDKSMNLWSAAITVKNKRIRFGRTKNEYKAALMYNEGATKLLGEKAQLNILTHDEIFQSKIIYPRAKYQSKKNKKQ
jgi:hypothetical protein